MKKNNIDGNMFRKTYQRPTIFIVALRQQSRLLSGSNGGGDSVPNNVGLQWVDEGLDEDDH